LHHHLLVNSGAGLVTTAQLGARVTVTSSVANSIAVVTIQMSTITHFYIVQHALHPGHVSAEPNVGELRFIALPSKSALQMGLTQSEVNGAPAIMGSNFFWSDALQVLL
jgi:rhamnogalacturonan endolyase